MISLLAILFTAPTAFIAGYLLHYRGESDRIFRATITGFRTGFDKGFLEGAAAQERVVR